MTATAATATRRLYVPEDVFLDVRAHALEQPPGWESGGWLLFVEDRAVAYQRSANAAMRPGTFAYPDVDVYPVVDDADAVQCHSHPLGPPGPSVQDLEVARLSRVDLKAIYSVRYDQLKIWRVLEDGYEAAPLRVEKPWWLR